MFDSNDTEAPVKSTGSNTVTQEQLRASQGQSAFRHQAHLYEGGAISVRPLPLRQTMIPIIARQNSNEGRQEKYSSKFSFPFLVFPFKCH